MILKMLLKWKVKRRTKNARIVLRAFDQEFERGCSDQFCGIFYANFVTVTAMQGQADAIRNLPIIVEETIAQMEETMEAILGMRSQQT